VHSVLLVQVQAWTCATPRDKEGRIAGVAPRIQGHSTKTWTLCRYSTRS
jgi:hypothetical protein